MIARLLAFPLRVWTRAYRSADQADTEAAARLLDAARTAGDPVDAAFFRLAARALTCPGDHQ